HKTVWIRAWSVSRRRCIELRDMELNNSEIPTSSEGPQQLRVTELFLYDDLRAMGL
ncbi:hypothetical protein HAX54_007106, partial [Datura stramonium]|nr:hypothetical protein [Datura stramonium]